MQFPDPSAAESAFYAAFQTLDIEKMRDVWADSVNTSCIHPGGQLLQGTEAVVTSWSDIFRDSQPPQISYRVIQTSVDERLAVHTVEETVVSGSGQRKAIVLATNIYMYSALGWRMLAHHASLPLVEKSSPQTESPALH